MMMNTTHMLLLMFLSGIFSSMSVWADKFSDVRISINDIYMSLLMCAWMLVFMGAWMGDLTMVFIGLLGVMILFYFIRNQTWIGPKGYVTSMIPHHSMAILMSKRLLEKTEKEKINIDPTLVNFAKNIIQTQKEEIRLLKLHPPKGGWESSALALKSSLWG